jgi:hypothetical protein
MSNKLESWSDQNYLFKQATKIIIVDKNIFGQVMTSLGVTQDWIKTNNLWKSKITSSKWGKGFEDK